MGDRCDVFVTVHKDDVKRMQNILGGGYTIRTDNNLVTLTEDNMSEGGYELLLAAVRDGIIFMGSHGPGHEYLAAEFCSDGISYMDMPTWEGNYVVFADETGEVSETDIHNLKKFISKRKRVKELLSEG